MTSNVNCLKIGSHKCTVDGCIRGFSNNQKLNMHLFVAHIENTDSWYCPYVSCHIYCADVLDLATHCRDVHSNAHLITDAIEKRQFNHILPNCNSPEKRAKKIATQLMKKCNELDTNTEADTNERKKNSNSLKTNDSNERNQAKKKISTITTEVPLVDLTEEDVEEEHNEVPSQRSMDTIKESAKDNCFKQSRKRKVVEEAEKPKKVMTLKGNDAEMKQRSSKPTEAGDCIKKRHRVEQKSIVKNSALSELTENENEGQKKNDDEREKDKDQTSIGKKNRMERPSFSKSKSRESNQRSRKNETFMDSKDLAAQKRTKDWKNMQKEGGLVNNVKKQNKENDRRNREILGKARESPELEEMAAKYTDGNSLLHPSPLADNLAPSAEKSCLKGLTKSHYTLAPAKIIISSIEKEIMSKMNQPIRPERPTLSSRLSESEGKPIRYGRRDAENSRKRRRSSSSHEEDKEKSIHQRVAYGRSKSPIRIRRHNSVLSPKKRFNASFSKTFCHKAICHNDESDIDDEIEEKFLDGKYNFYIVGKKMMFNQVPSSKRSVVITELDRTYKTEDIEEVTAKFGPTSSTFRSDNGWMKVRFEEAEDAKLCIEEFASEFKGRFPPKIGYFKYFHKMYIVCSRLIRDGALTKYGNVVRKPRSSKISKYSSSSRRTKPSESELLLVDEVNQSNESSSLGCSNTRSSNREQERNIITSSDMDISLDDEIDQLMHVMDDGEKEQFDEDPMEEIVQEQVSLKQSKEPLPEDEHARTNVTKKVNVDNQPSVQNHVPLTQLEKQPNCKNEVHPNDVHTTKLPSCEPPVPTLSPNKGVSSKSVAILKKELAETTEESSTLPEIDDVSTVEAPINQKKHLIEVQPSNPVSTILTADVNAIPLPTSQSLTEPQPCQTSAQPSYATANPMFANNQVPQGMQMFYQPVVQPDQNGVLHTVLTPVYVQLLQPQQTYMDNMNYQVLQNVEPTPPPPPQMLVPQEVYTQSHKTDKKSENLMKNTLLNSIRISEAIQRSSTVKDQAPTPPLEHDSSSTASSSRTTSNSSSAEKIQPSETPEPPVDNHHEQETEPNLSSQPQSSHSNQQAQHHHDKDRDTPTVKPRFFKCGWEHCFLSKKEFNFNDLRRHVLGEHRKMRFCKWEDCYHPNPKDMRKHLLKHIDLLTD